MEWNSARLKLPVLEGETAPKKSAAETAPPPVVSPFANLSFGQLCKIGFAMTWPLLLIALVALGVFVAILMTTPVRH